MSFFGEGRSWLGRPLGGGLPASEDTDEHLARRAATLFAAGLIVVALGGLVFLLLRDDGSDDPAQTATATEIGPLPGTELSSYTSAREKALDDATGERLAVVSLPRYATEPEARAAVGSLSVVTLLAAPPGGAPSAVTGSMAEWADAQVAASREERDEFLKLIPTVDDQQFREFYQEEVARLNQVVDAVKPDGPLVFAVVVRGPATALQRLAENPGVRLVDVGPSRAASGATYRGLRPEETVTAGEPPIRPG